MNLKINSSSLSSHRFLVMLMGLVALILSCMPLTQTSDDLLFGLFMRFLPTAKTDSQTVIVAIDDLMSGTGEPVSHVQLAELITRLDKANVIATGVFLSLLPQQSSVDVEHLQNLIAKSEPAAKKQLGKALELLKGDSRLAYAFSKSGKVVLPVGYLSVADTIRWLPENIHPLEVVQHETGTLPGLITRLSAVPKAMIENRRFPDNVFMSSVKALGIVMRDSDMTAIPLLVRAEDGLYPAFLLQMVALKYSRKNNDYYVIKNKGIQLGKQYINAGPDYRLFPHPLELPGDNILIVNAGDILSGKYKMSHFRDKLVLVGQVSDDRPPAAGLITMQGREALIHMARTIDAIVSEKYYNQPDWLYGLQRGVIILVVIFLLLVPEKMRGLIGSAIYLFLALIILNVSLIILITQNSWLPLTIPVWLLFFSSLILPLRHRIANGIMYLRYESERAYRDLAQNYQSQGRLDTALDCLSKCPVDAVTAEPLYSLGMDFERRRQFGKALSIYQRIAQAIPGFRDIQERSGKLSVMPECFASPATATAASVSSGSATIIIDDLIIPRPIIGRYQIERELGRGAMGMVYLGHDPKISRTVAIKTMALADEFDEGHLDEVKRRFYQEAETAGQLNHPNIVTIYDVGEEHDLAYIAMDYIDGKSLDFYTKTDSLLSIEEVFDIGIHIADALSYAHDRKVVHRDVKPANIMYDNKGHVLKVMDFGIACLTDNSKTRTGSVLGSPFYMSPEQIAGKRVDGRSDLYSLGVTLYQLFTGHLPFAGDSMAALMYQIANEKAASIRKIRDELPVCLVRIINQAMEKDISKRYQSGHLMADALFSCAERQGLTASLRARR